MSEVDLDDIKRRMEGSLNSLKTEFMGLRAGRASTGMLEPVMVDAYGSKMPMSQVGNISAPEPRLITVTVWDASLTASVEKAIRESDLGLTPMAEGTLVRVPIPDLSEDELGDMEGNIQKLTDDHVKMIDDALANKEKEITQV